MAQVDRPFNSPLFQYYPASRVAGSVLYALALGDEGQTRAYAADAGGARLVPFIEAVSQGLAVWPGDQAQLPRLAWDRLTINAENNTAASQLWIASADGTDARSILEETGAGRALVAGRWSRDGQRLFFSKEPLGLGGYILFGGASNLWAYNLADGSAAALLPDPGVACIDDLSPDETLIAHHCANTTLSIVQIASGTTTTINPPEGVEANFTGSARFSQNGPQVAFAIARGNPDNEQGWVAVSDGLEGPSRLVAASPAGQYFQVAAWLDADTLVLQSWGATPGVWLVNSDGSDLRQIAEGIYHGH
jgi:Tol biopolymer transport system component